MDEDHGDLVNAHQRILDESKLLGELITEARGSLFDVNSVQHRIRLKIVHALRFVDRVQISGKWPSLEETLHQSAQITWAFDILSSIALDLGEDIKSTGADILHGKLATELGMSSETLRKYIKDARVTPPTHGERSRLYDVTEQSAILRQVSTHGSTQKYRQKADRMLVMIRKKPGF